ncbi:MAG: hypothetical protein JWR53_1041 [Glaciihabitans sp.]|nr:hypothetical protein [Glaciihabitans sp.]
MIGGSAFWAAYALVYDRIWDAPVTARIAAAVVEAIGDARSVLDLGAGTGLIAHAVTASGRTVVAVDPSGAMLRRAIGRDAAHRYIASTRPARDLRTDAAILVNVLHASRAPSDVLSVAVAATSGRIIVVWPHDDVRLRDLARWDREGGASRRAVAASLLLRIAVGLPGSLLGIRRTTDAALRELVTHAAEARGHPAEYVDIPSTGCVLATM